MMVHLQLEELSNWLFSVLLLGGLLFVGLFNIVVYLVRRRLRVHYYFGMICVFYFTWYLFTVAEFELFPTILLSEQYKAIISVMCTTQMILYLMLYTMGTLGIRKPSYEKGLKIWANTLFIACLLMPFSAIYMASLTLVIEVFNAVAQLYLFSEVIKVAKNMRKDIRIMNVMFFFLIFMSSVAEIIGIQFRDNTIVLAFFMIALQAIILALHYNSAIIEVEQVNEGLEKKVADRTADLVQKEKETIHLITSISHDLRTPISVVGGYMELLQSDSSINETNTEYISNSLVRLLQMEKLTLDLFTLSQISDKNYVFQLERINIAETIEQIAILYKDQVKQKNIMLKTDVMVTDCIADKMRVMQVLDNLLINALAYAKSSIAIYAVENSGVVEVTIFDDGAGINPAEIPHVFDRFYKKRQRGSGIGLSNVKELVERMNGEVTVDSELDKGTKFIFTLPLASDE